ncbi:hypothetical protein [Cerasicoccus fimbriatus]|uniref:hypothetical protein n=1 Tax=Cerasicoccus fimbriatus TaxID=3014554 RepID=UPI0022B52602|nr:hypothetical protein [Cerasicoccus sp. TK19100]
MRLAAIISLCILIPLYALAQEAAAEPQNIDATPEFVFEGDVDYVDPVLRDDIGPPRVLSGTMTTISHTDERPAVVRGKIVPDVSLVTNAEFTLDRNYVISYQATTDKGAVQVVLGEAKEEDDVISIVCAFESATPLSSGYTIQYLVIFMKDDDGEMIEEAIHFYTAPTYQEATFELTFINPETGETAKATGEITMFANLDSDVTPEEDYQQLEKQILELDTMLQAKQAQAAELQQLIDAQIRELNRHDAIIAEMKAQQEQLARENEQLRSGEAYQAMAEANAALRERHEQNTDARQFSAATVAQMTVRQESLAKDNADLARSNADLREQLAEALTEISAIRGKQELLSRQSDKEFDYSLPPAPEPAPKPNNLPRASITTVTPVTNATPPVNESLSAMALAAVDEPSTADTQPGPGEAITPNADKMPPGTITGVREPSAVVNPEQAQGQWRFPLPMSATIDSAPQSNATPAPQSGESDEDSSHVNRRGPRR